MFYEEGPKSSASAQVLTSPRNWLAERYPSSTVLEDESEELAGFRLQLDQMRQRFLDAKSLLNEPQHASMIDRLLGRAKDPSDFKFLQEEHKKQNRKRCNYICARLNLSLVLQLLKKKIGSFSGLISDAAKAIDPKELSPVCTGLLLDERNLTAQHLANCFIACNNAACLTECFTSIEKLLAEANKEAAVEGAVDDTYGEIVQKYGQRALSLPFNVTINETLPESRFSLFDLQQWQYIVDIEQILRSSPSYERKVLSDSSLSSLVDLEAKVKDTYQHLVYANKRLSLAKEARGSLHEEQYAARLRKLEEDGKSKGPDKDALQEKQMNLRRAYWGSRVKLLYAREVLNCSLQKLQKTLMDALAAVRTVFLNDEIALPPLKCNFLAADAVLDHALLNCQSCDRELEKDPTQGQAAFAALRAYEQLVNAKV